MGVFVTPVMVQSRRGGSVHRSGRIESEEANAYSVEIRTSMGTAAESWDPVVNFTDPRTAWEFAHLLTHFFEARHDSRPVKADLLTDGPYHAENSESLSNIVEDLDAQEAFLTLLHPSVVPGSMENIFDDDKI